MIKITSEVNQIETKQW